MTKRPAILITGAGGEVGHSLIEYFTKKNEFKVIGADIRKIHTPSFVPDDFLKVTTDITDKDAVSNLFTKYEIHKVFHLAAILSSGAERCPEKAHEVNVQGSINLMTAARSHGEKIGRSVVFMYPSTMAVYGIPSQEEKKKAGKVSEGEFLFPITAYGANKLYIEHMGRYFSNHYMQLETVKDDYKLDFRAVRFPGLMSADTVPTGGTSDYGSEMIHAAAQNKEYKCFVSRDVKIPFMAMTDAIRALIELSEAPRNSLTQNTYNVTAFSVSAQQIKEALISSFPKFEATFEPHVKRENIVHSWPEDMDDSRATKDWGWKPEYQFKECFETYLIPNIVKKYHQ